MDKQALRQKLDALGDSIKNAAKDLSSLEVTTYSGKLEISSAGGIDGTKFNISKLSDSLNKELMKPDFKLKLVAYTKYEVDLDATTIVKEDLTEGELILVEAHKNVVKASLEGRQAFVEMIKQLINS